MWPSIIEKFYKSGKNCVESAQPYLSNRALLLGFEPELTMDTVGLQAAGLRDQPRIPAFQRRLKSVFM